MTRCSWGAQDVAALKTSKFTATEKGPKSLSINKLSGECSGATEKVKVKTGCNMSCTVKSTVISV